MVCDQTIYVGNASTEKIFVRATYEKWQKLKFSTEVKLLSGPSVGGNLDFTKDSEFTEGITALAPHHTLKMIGSFFSAEVEPPPGAAVPATGTRRIRISRNYRVPNNHAILVTSQHTVQVVQGRARWKELCNEVCPFMFREKKKKSLSLRPRGRGKQKLEAPPQPCPLCDRGGATKATS